MKGKIVYIDTKSNLETKLKEGTIPSSSVVFIEDVGQIYFNGTYFGAYSVLSKTSDGLAPKGGDKANSQISNVDTEWVLTVTSGANPSWRKLPANAFNNTDTKVLQSLTTTGNYRPIVLGYNRSTEATQVGLTTETTNIVYTPYTIYAQPSTGTLYTNNLKINNTDAAQHISFSRGSATSYPYNYICAPEGGIITISPNNAGVSSTSGMQFDSTGLHPATNAAYSLGTESHTWNTLYARAIYVPGTQKSTAVISADTGDNLYFKIGESSNAKIPLVLDLNELAVRPGASHTNTFDLGTSSIKWKNVYATTLNGALAYTNLTGSTTTANQVIVSNGTANGWTLKTLGSNAFNSTAYLPLSGGTITGSILIPKGSYIQGVNENGGVMLMFDGTRTVLGSVGDTSTGYTHIRSKDAKVTVGSGNAASYTLLHTGNYSDTLDGRYYTESEIDTKLGNYVTLNTNQIITGIKNFSTDSNTNPLKISRNGGNVECLNIGADDNTSYFHFIQDEKTANFKFIGEWNDTENSDGSNAGSKYVSFLLSNSKAKIELNDGTNTHTVLHSGIAHIKDGKITINDTSITPVTLDGTQTITGLKTFKNIIYGNQYNNSGNKAGAYLILNKGGNYLGIGASSTNTQNIAIGESNLDGTWISELLTITPTGNLTASKLITSGGTSNQFVKGDGSLDSTSYATSTSLGNYVTLNTDQVITSNKTFSGRDIKFKPNTTGVNNLGIYNINSVGNLKDTITAGIGFHNNVGQFSSIYLGWGDTPQSQASNVTINDTVFTYKGSVILRSDNVHTYAVKVGGNYYKDLNDLTINGTYYVGSGSTNNPANFGQLLVMRNGDTTTQLYVPYSTSQSISWRGWSDLAKENNSIMDWATVLDSLNSYINNGIITINGRSITPITSLEGYVKFIKLPSQTSKLLSDKFNVIGVSNKGDDSTQSECPTNYGAFIAIASNADKNSGFQIYGDTSNHNKGIYYRARQAGDSNVTYQDWRRVLDENNYIEYVYSKTSADSTFFNYKGTINNAVDFNSLRENGIYWNTTGNNAEVSANAPSTYGFLLNFATPNNSYPGVQVHVYNNMHYRRGWYNSTNNLLEWSSWKTVLDSDNYSSYIYSKSQTDDAIYKAIAGLVGSAPETLDTLEEISKYLEDGTVVESITNSLAGKVSKAGDTMTGVLSIKVPNNTSAGLGLSSTITNVSIVMQCKISDATHQGHIVYRGNSTYSVTDNGWNTSYNILHAGNYTDYVYSKTQSDSKYLSDLSIEGNYLKYTKNGNITSLEIPYIPSSAGTSGQVLISTGSTPIWDFIQTTNNMLDYGSCRINSPATGSFEPSTGIYTVTIAAESDGYPGIAFVGASIPWGKKLTIRFECYSDITTTLAVDHNCTGTGLSGNDNYGQFSASASSITVNTKAGEWVECFISHSNNNEEKNPNKVDLNECSVLYKQTIGITFKIRNVRAYLGDQDLGWSPTKNDLSISTLTLDASKLTIGNVFSSKSVTIPTWNQNTTGNAATATKLATSRTIWGQSFNGTSNITGDLTSVGSITATGQLILNSTGEHNIGLRRNSLETNAVCLVEGAFRPYYSSHQKLNLGIANASWNKIYGAALTLTENATIGGTLFTKSTVYTHGKTASSDGKAGITLASNFLGITASTPSINFYYNNSSDITSQIKETSAGNLTVSNSLTTSKFIKTNSSDDYVLLGGGGHKEIDDLVAGSNITTIEKTLTVTQDWMDTGIKYTDLPDTSTYIIQVKVSANNSTGQMYTCYWSGIMSWYNEGTNDTESDEIILHRSGHAYGNTIYLRTIMSTNSDGRHLRLQIAANKDLGASYTYTFKFKKMI